jgi:hypothetical protein
MIKNLDKIIKQVLKEATGTGGGGRGSYVLPVQPGVKLFDKSQLAPFTDEVSKYIDAELEYDSYDGQMSTPKKQIKKMEANAKKISKYKKAHPVQNDDDGDILNNINIKEATSNGGGEYNAPLSFEHIEWEEHTTAPYINHSTHEHNKKGKLGNIRGKVSFKHWFMEKDHPNKGKTKKLITPKEYQDVVNEDLAVWFGTKKKPKGSSQPKGPWVNICRKDKNGKHPPCGRPEASDKGYPKCRAAGVAGKMSDSEKRSACQQKRKAEKTHSKSGTGNKPKMVSYKTNENMAKRITITESQLESLVHYLSEQNTLTSIPPINLACFDLGNITGPGTQMKNLTFKSKNGDTYTFETTSFDGYQKKQIPKDFTKVKIENQEFKDFLTRKGVTDVDTRSFLYTTNNFNQRVYCSVFIRNSQDQTFADNNTITTLKNPN